MQERGGVNRYKKFNPNPVTEQQIPDIEPFPEYDTWKSMMEAGTLPSEFDVQPDYDIPTPGATTPGRFVEPTRGGIAEFQDVLKPFEFGTPERIGRAEEFYEVPGAMPTETGMPTEEGMVGIPPEFQQLAKYLGITKPQGLVDLIKDATDKDLERFFQLAGVKDEEVVLSQYSDEELVEKYKTGEISTSDYEDELKSREAIKLITGEKVEDEEITLLDKVKEREDVLAKIYKGEMELTQYPLDYLLKYDILEAIPVNDLIQEGFLELENIQEVANEIQAGIPREELISSMEESWGVDIKIANLIYIKAEEWLSGQ